MKRFGTDEVDVCIIGSGAGGGPLALTLARAGCSVVILEKGPWYKAEDFTHDEIAISRRDFFVPYPSAEPHLLSRKQGDPLEPSSLGWTANCVGGGTVHMSGYVFRLHPEDFALANRYRGIPGHTLADWPITYQELAPYYDMVEREVGVSGKAGEYPFEPPRAGPYPFPPLAFNPLAARVDDACKKLGLHPFQTPRAIVSSAADGRSACVYCNYCGSFGCEVNAKSSTAASVIPKAIATDHCELRDGCMAYEIATDKEGRATAVRYITKTGERVEQKARVICVAATAIESARLLLASKSAAHPDGLGNKSGLVGKNLSFSTLAKVYGALERAALPDAERADHPIHFLQRSLQDDYFVKGRKGYDKGGTIVFQLAHRSAVYTAERLARRRTPLLWGEALKREIFRAYKDVIELEAEVFGEFLPNPHTFVALDASTKDKWGLAVAAIHVDNHPEDVAVSRVLADKARAVLEAAGARQLGSEAVGGTTFVLQHGTARFGDDKKTSVLDRHCKSHEVPNLYVTDGSFMPSSGGVPSTLTIMANSFRVGAHLAALRRNGALR
ncbi:MAG: GMC family oxidoreductase [Deltaproteobacteria bacterium]|nr:GMC family oxidoreductase [Deltaproteobacteria bacterium]